jgi:hypothetical protein
MEVCVKFHLTIAISLALLLASCGPELMGRFVISTPQGGFANRLRAMASAYAFAKQTNRILIVKWRKEPKHMEGISNIEQIFQKNDSLYISFDSLSPQQQISLERKWKKFTISAKREDVYDGAKELSDSNDNIINIVSGATFKPFGLEDKTYIKNIQEFYRRLKLNENLENKVEAFKNSHFDAPAMVGVHYRSFTTGDADFGGTKDMTPIFVRTIKDIIAKNPATKFFLATDSKEIKELLRSELGSDHIVTFSLGEVNRNSLSGLIDAVTEWYLLTKTDYIVGTYQSSFSDEAAHLTKEKRKINIGPTLYGSDAHSIICFDKLGHPFIRPDESGDPCFGDSIAN